MSTIPHVVLYTILLMCELGGRLGGECDERTVDVFEAGVLSYRVELAATGGDVLVRSGPTGDATATIERSRHVAHLFVFHGDPPAIVDLRDVFSTIVTTRREIRVQSGKFPGEWIIRSDPAGAAGSPVTYVSNGALGIVAIARSAE